MSAPSRVHVTRARRGDLTCHYQGQSRPQPTFIALDIRNGEMWATYNPEIGNSVPMDVWHGLVRRYPIHTQYVARANELMRAILPLAERVMAGASEHWSGSNFVGRLTLAASVADLEIGEYLDSIQH